MKGAVLAIVIGWAFVAGVSTAAAQTTGEPEEVAAQRSGFAADAIFDDQMLLDGYYQKFSDEPQEILLAMINDDSVSPYKMAAAVKVFKDKFAPQVFARDKAIIEKLLFHRLARTDSAFVNVEIMATLVVMDRYRYFSDMVPALIKKMDHYNRAVSDLAYNDLTELTGNEEPRVREARIVFNTLRKILFLSRKKLQSITEPDEKLQQKLNLLRWSVKVLGTQQLKQLPPEVLGLL